ncbi:hypothetical protein SERLA73DRAFT_186098 [Serpula lacrymans var. lacrymans S7.3]|uniref:DUF6699 domain-containing protein n=2 Tax=Serpula lacrymans var. lacrymans TaxID=341189 RepID=F8Q6Y3_SERL3|nr:uncharacterized protein SERLADRAFT_474960 [Serpula lacrymans var. lacrymans S7.9]EGN96371.1 hypothetical protein SERLA73DRAFT_186098 [Serpula lacrymans var. lacrymans S7.3]EGO21908.1 hypothetical protein SERLADRAFT_474960 [Serpula lacrymans var. lacrymans S7.9]
MDRMNPFAEGPHYGPVLEPFLVRVVRANVKINPLLAPPNDATDDYLQWNMVFGTSNCHRSTDPRRSWIKGRGEPATHPRLSSLRIICHSFPGMITIQARDPKIGITCGEILDRISHYLYGDVIRTEYDSIPRARKKTIYQSYQHNRSTHPNVPGGSLGDGMRRLDYLCADSMFGGIVQNDNFVKDHCGDALPCTYELKCLPNYPLTQQELRDQQQRTREAERARRARSRASSRGSGSQSETDE